MKATNNRREYLKNHDGAHDDVNELGLPPTFGSMPLGPLAQQHKEALRQVGAYDPLRLATCFGALLTDPELQANCLRLEVLTHLCLALGNGKKKPTPKLISSLFSTIGRGPAGWMEDPAENLFVSNICTRRGNFRVFEGVWESAGFHTQRVIDSLESMPDGFPYDEMRESIYGLLKLSDQVCERAGLARNTVGHSEPRSALLKSSRDNLRSRRMNIRFTEEKIQEIGIDISNLVVFMLDPSRRNRLTEDVIGHSELERHPLVYRNGEIHLLLPTAVSAAIRRFVVDQMEALGLGRTFARIIANEYAHLMSYTHLLGQHAGADLEFKETENGLLSGISARVDEGVFINLIFVCDTLEGFQASGLIGTLPEANHIRLSQDIEVWIDHAYREACKTDGFREGLTIVVACGVGRGMLHRESDNHEENWRVEFIPATDLVTLSRLYGFNTLSLLRILEGRDKVAEIGVNLENINGLLNMVAWARMLGGHLVPHASIPEGFGTGGGYNFIVIDQNGLLQLREEVARSVDEHVCADINGRWLPVFKDGESLFQEDRDKPYYVCVQSGSRWPLGVYETAGRAWWVELETTDETPGYVASQRHEMLKTWLQRTAPVLDRAFDSELPPALLWKACFEGRLGDRSDPGLESFPTIEDALSHIGIQVDGTTLTMSITEQFEYALQNPENVGECALVTRLVEGIALLAGVDLNDADKNTFLEQIVTSPDARQAHAFIAKGFRDYVHNSVWRSPIKIDVDDAATFKLGLGWRLRDRAEGSEILGKRECTDYLNRVVKLLESEVCEELKALDRQAVIMFALLNHESANVDRDLWRRTSRAVIALHND